MDILFAVVGTSGIASKAISTIGFTETGITKGTIAAKMMKNLGGANTPAGGIVATCQRIGATGSGLGSVTAVATPAIISAVAGPATLAMVQSMSRRP